MQDNGTSSNHPMPNFQDQDPCLLSTHMQESGRESQIVNDATRVNDVNHETANSTDAHQAFPPDVRTAALRTTKARLILDASFSDLCEAIEAYNEAVRCKAHLRALHGLTFSP